MVSKVDSYKCDLCDAYYISEDEAKRCEEIHVLSDQLEISDRLYGRDKEYPIAVVIDDGSGHGGLYTLQTEGSIEGVFEEFDRIKDNPSDDGY